jgi:hypothetical protein
MASGRSCWHDIWEDDRLHHYHETYLMLTGAGGEPRGWTQLLASHTDRLIAFTIIDVTIISRGLTSYFRKAYFPVKGNSVQSLTLFTLSISVSGNRVWII